MPGVLLAVAALAASPGRSVAQRALKDFRPWSSPRVSRQHTVWAMPSGLEQSSTLKSTVSLMLLSAPSPLPARLSRPSWGASDLALASAFTVTLLLDAAQTRALARGGWRNFRETNPILGPHPSVGRVNTYTVVSALTVLGAAAALPARLRSFLLGGALAVETFTIAGTAQQGVAIRFP